MPIQSTSDRINEYLKVYKKALEENRTAEAVRFGEFAYNDAKAALERDPLSPQASYYKQVMDAIKPFLDNPEIGKPKKASADQGSKDNGAKETDWFSSDVPKERLKDIAGLRELKEQFLVNIFAAIDPKYKATYEKYRGDEKGLQVLLYGPPGTGKTHAVKCLAGQMGCRIAVVQVKDVMANLVGDGAKIIDAVFEQANKYDKCIIFFDEIDAIASSREGEDSRHTKEQLTTLLTRMDGFTSAAKPGQIRIIIAATNRPASLDSAVKRGGRFDTQIYVPLPDKEARAALIRMALTVTKSGNKTSVPLADDVKLDRLAELFEGYSGADIKAICRQASGLALAREIKASVSGKAYSDAVRMSDFEEVLDRYINSITDTDLAQYDAYSLNMAYSDEYFKHKTNQLCSRVLKEQPIDAWEYRWLESYHDMGMVDNSPAVINALLRMYARKCERALDDRFFRDTCDEILKKLYNRLTVRRWEREWLLELCKNGYVRSQFGKLYDLRFLTEYYGIEVN